jgi:hypothetical protein
MFTKNAWCFACNLVGHGWLIVVARITVLLREARITGGRE